MGQKKMSGKYLEDILEPGTALEEAMPALKVPRKYKVLLLNDDYTPMEFVIEVLQRFFHKDAETATNLMLQVHTQGKATCGVYTRDIAETKVGLVNDYSRSFDHPLLCNMESE